LSVLHFYSLMEPSIRMLSVLLRDIELQLDTEAQEVVWFRNLFQEVLALADRIILDSEHKYIPTLG